MEDRQYAAMSGYLKHGIYPAVLRNPRNLVILWRICKNYKLLKSKLYYKEQIQDGTERDRFVAKRSEADSFSWMH